MEDVKTRNKVNRSESAVKPGPWGGRDADQLSNAKAAAVFPAKTPDAGSKGTAKHK